MLLHYNNAIATLGRAGAIILWPWLGWGAVGWCQAGPGKYFAGVPEKVGAAQIVVYIHITQT